MQIVPMETTEAIVRIAYRWGLLILLGAFFFASDEARVRAQEANARGQAATQAQRTTPEDSDAAVRAEADRLDGLGGEPEALLGAPAAPGDAYDAAVDAAQGGERALARTERVPRGATVSRRDEPQPAAKPHAPLRRMPAGDPPHAGKIDKADPGTRSPTESALSIYHGPGDVGRAVGEVYKMPW